MDPSAIDPPHDVGKYRSSWSVPLSSTRNSLPIATTLAPLLSPLPPHSIVLELSSGFGHQLAALASLLPSLSFQPTEADDYLTTQIDRHVSASHLDNVRPARTLDLLDQQDWLDLAHSTSLTPPSSLQGKGGAKEANAKRRALFDAVLICNLTHIAPWAVTESVFAHLDPRLTYLTQDGQVPILDPAGLIAIYGAFNEHGRVTSEGNRQFDETIKKRDPRFGLRDVQGEVVPLAERHGWTLKQRIEMPAGNLMLLFQGSHVSTDGR